MLPYEDNQEKIELRSDEVQEILGTPPGWLVRWGTTLSLLCFIIMVAAGWMLRYPDVKSADIVLTTAQPPVEIVAPTDGYIEQLLVRDTATVQRGQVLAVMQSTANYPDIRLLDSCAAQWIQMEIAAFAQVSLPEPLDLGEVQNAYTRLINDMERYRFGASDKTDAASANMLSIRRQIDQLQLGISSDERSVQRTQKLVAQARENTSKQEDLFQQGLISRLMLNDARQRQADAERQLELLEDGILRKKSEIFALEKNINELSFSTRTEESSATVQLRESLNALRQSLDSWKQQHLIQTPIQGLVSLNAALFSARQFVKEGEQLMTVVPALQRDTKILGRISLPVAGSGKVQKGQRVVVKLDNYPFHEYGSIEGIVASKSTVPKNNAYNIIVLFPDKLETNYHKPIPFEQQMQGKAEIIVDNKRFLQRILEQIFSSGR